MLDWIPAAITAALICAGVPTATENRVADGWESTCLEVAYRAQVEQELDASVAVSIAWHESWLDYDAFGSAGERGPLQVLPNIWCRGSSQCDHIRAGLRALRTYVDRYGYHDAMCRYRGAPVGCPSSEIRMEFAHRLRVLAGVSHD